MTRVRWGVVVLLLAVVTAGTSCDYQPATLKPWAPEDPSGQVQRVVLFGDSLGAMAESTVMGQAHAADRSGESWSYNAVGGTRVQHWLEAMARVGGSDVVIFELGTNNALLEAINTGELPTNLHNGLAALRQARCVVAFTINTTSANLRGFPFSTRARWVNDELHRLIESDEYPNVVLLNWDAESTDRTDWLSSDNLHYNTLGTLAFADAIARAPELCAG